MRTVISFARVLLTVFLFSTACSSSRPEDVKAERQPTPGRGKTLIVYLSRTGNTKAIAENIQARTGGDLVELELQKPYPEDYRAAVDQVSKENERGYLPPLKTKIDGIDKYEVVFLGFPTWGMQLPPPVKSFLRQYDLSGKTVAPFNTNGGYGVGSSIQTIKELCPNSKILDAFVTRGGLERDGELLVIKGERGKEAQAEVDEWLKRIGIISPSRF
jgi:flavodoxin